ncbi:MAG: hypothetical protein EHM61_22175 [Acidobacteria bacterium]|nr:MAG: hypothetical protein EHM61_22175 [Acidobacteriota bacterium]
MKTRKPAFAFVALFLLILAPVIADDDAKTKTIEKDVIFTAPAPPPDIAFGPMVFEKQAMDIKVVTGAPYSAEGMTEAVQVLADGNRIVRRNSTRVARDSQGRTRQEYSFTPPGGGEPRQVTMISINDPTTGVSFTLHPETRTADKIILPEILTFDVSEGSGTVIYKPGAGEPGVAGEAGAHVFIHKTPGGGTGVVATASIPAPHVARFKMAMAYGGEDGGTTEQLGRQIIEGLEAEGKRTTITIPAGQIGNEQPIIITSEQWYSPELQTIIYSKRDDPMAGTTIYRLTNISRAEPDPALFQLPPDYTVEREDVKVRAFERKIVKPEKK